MIRTDQPTCFPSELVVRVSSRDDGTMLDRTIGIHTPAIVANRRRFCQQNGINYDDVVYHRIVYGPQRTYELISEVDAGSATRYTSEIVADALVTTQANVGLFLPVADCVATVLYDPVCHRLALLHLGRHSTLTSLLQRVIKRFIAEGSRSQDIIVWMSPSAQRASYVLEYFDQADEGQWRDFCERQADGIHLDLPGYNQVVCQQAGVLTEHIYRSPIDTATNDTYFSHSAGDTTGRFAVVAMMKL